VPVVDVITFGAPCQDLSVAGKRAGMKSALMGDEETTRSGLFFDSIRIIKEMRNHEKLEQLRSGRTDQPVRPRFAIYENVYGAFSSNKGEDFRAVLEEMARVKDPDAVIPRPEGGWTACGNIVGDGYSLAWRGHDAQYWGVPQRRKRICVLADFEGDSAGRLLFETELWRETADGTTVKVESDIREKSRSQVQPIGESVPRYTQPGGETGQEVAGDAGNGIETTGKCLNSWDVQSKHIQPADGIAESLYSGECRYGGGESYVLDQQPLLLESNQNHATVQTDGISTALPASMGMGGGYVPMVLNDQGGSVMNVSEDQTGALRAEEHGHQPIIYGISAYDSNAMKSPNPESGIYEADTARTLDLNGGSPACNQGGMAVVFNGANVTSPVNASNPKAGDPCHTLTDDDRNYVICIEGNGTRESHRGDGYKESETMYTLNTIEQHAVAYGLDRASFNQGQNAQYDFAVEEEVAPTLVAKGPGGVLKTTQ